MSDRRGSLHVEVEPSDHPEVTFFSPPHSWTQLELVSSKARGMFSATGPDQGQLMTSHTIKHTLLLCVLLL